MAVLKSEWCSVHTHELTQAVPHKHRSKGLRQAHASESPSSSCHESRSSQLRKNSSSEDFKVLWRRDYYQSCLLNEEFSDAK